MGFRWMTSRALACVSGLAVVGMLSAFGSPAAAQPAGPSGEELRAARELFREAYQDEQEKRFVQALDKFQRVAAVKESASVRYRIASVLESLSRLREARDAFRALAASKVSLRGPEQDIADAAAERAHRLDKRVPRLILELPPDAPPDVRVTIDGASAPVATAASPRPIELEPGAHLIQASSPTSRTSETTVTLLEGSEVVVRVVLEPRAATAVPAPAPPPPAPVIVSPPPPPARDKTVAFVALAGGTALFVTGVVLLAVREGHVSDLAKLCPGNVCPSAKRADVESTRDQAQLFGPLGVTAGLVGLAGVGLGGWLFFRPSPDKVPPASAAADVAGSHLRVAARPVLGGALLGLSGTF